MDCLQKIWEHPLYQEHYRKLQKLERERELCCHTLEHFLDVARLTYIYALEEGLSVSRKVIYAAGLLTHRKKKKACKARLNELFYKADKGSRNCLICPASSQCSWSDEKKNLKIHY